MGKYDKTFLWSFLLGLGINTQIYFFGCIGISEVVMFIITPFIFAKDYRKLINDGFAPILCLFLLCAMGSMLSGAINGSTVVGVYKFLASLYSTFCAVVLFHRAITRNPYSVGAYCLGWAISGIISIFAFHPQASLEFGELDAVVTLEEQMEGVLFWVSKLKRFILIPISLAYYKTNLIILATLPLAHTVFSLTTSVSGRAAALVSIGATFLIIWGRKSRITMRLISRHFGVFCILVVLILVIFKQIYSYTAENGYLGYEAQRKYVHQTEQGDSMLKLLMGGRAEFFVGLRACLDKPLLGWGARPVDTNGYWYEFLSKYGSQQDLDLYIKSIKNNGFVFIPEHSHLVIYWLHCGIFGLIFQLYILFIIYQFFRRSISAIPQLFGFFVLMIPALVWDIFFTPLTNRVGTGLLFSAMLVANAIATGKTQMPQPFEIEARHYDRL